MKTYILTLITYLTEGFEIQFLDESQTEFERRENQKGPFLAVESSAYFEAYTHVLAGMQKIDPNKFPLERYIVRLVISHITLYSLYIYTVMNFTDAAIIFSCISKFNFTAATIDHLCCILHNVGNTIMVRRMPPLYFHSFW